MIGPHLSNAELEQAISQGTASLVLKRAEHAENCPQCRQELVELSKVFLWQPAETHGARQSVELAESVLNEWTRRRRERYVRIALVFLALLAVALLFVQKGSPLSAILLDPLLALFAATGLLSLGAALANLVAAPFALLASVGGGVLLLAVLVLCTIWGGDLLVKKARRQARRGPTPFHEMANRLLR